jgi:hypothetical protein
LRRPKGVPYPCGLKAQVSILKFSQKTQSFSKPKTLTKTT